MDKESVRQMVIMTKRSLHHMGPAPPSPVSMKEEPPSPPRVHVKRESTSPLRQVKDEPTSSPHNRDLHIGGRVKKEPTARQRLCHVKDEPTSPPPHSRYVRINGLITMTPPPPDKGGAAAGDRQRKLHYLGGGGYDGAFRSCTMVSVAERAARQQVRYDRRNGGCRSAFAKMDVASEWVCNDPDLAAAWALDRSVTTAETALGRRHHLDGELAKIDKEWSLSTDRVPPAHSVVG
jgi:hypothetical protein